jgi:hypothetical protein
VRDFVTNHYQLYDGFGGADVGSSQVQKCKTGKR